MTVALILLSATFSMRTSTPIVSGTLSTLTSVPEPVNV